MWTFGEKCRLWRESWITTAVLSLQAALYGVIQGYTVAIIILQQKTESLLFKTRYPEEPYKDNLSLPPQLIIYDLNLLRMGLGPDRKLKQHQPAYRNPSTITWHLLSSPMKTQVELSCTACPPAHIPLSTFPPLTRQVCFLSLPWDCGMCLLRDEGA